MLTYWQQEYTLKKDKIMGNLLKVILLIGIIFFVIVLIGLVLALGIAYLLTVIPCELLVYITAALLMITIVMLALSIVIGGKEIINKTLKG